MFQFTDIHFTHQRRNILVVFITGFGFGDGDLLKNRWPDFDHAEFSNIAAKLVQALGRPRRHDGAEVAGGHAILFLEDLRIFLRIEQAQRVIVDRTAFAVGAQHIDGHALHQRFQPFSQRRFTTAHRPQQIEDLFLLFQPLGGMLEIGNDLLNGVFHTVKLFKGRIACDDPV